jgi:hypothetical protein
MKEVRMAIDKVSGAAVALLAAHAATARADVSVEDASRDRLSQVRDLIQQKLEADRDDFARSALEQVAESPDAEDPQLALAEMIAQKARTDAYFREALEDLVEAAARDENVRALTESVATEGGKEFVARIRPS